MQAAGKNIFFYYTNYTKSIFSKNLVSGSAIKISLFLASKGVFILKIAIYDGSLGRKNFTLLAKIWRKIRKMAKITNKHVVFLRTNQYLGCENARNQ